MSLFRWNRLLPPGLLLKSIVEWHKLENLTQRLLIELAYKQEFRCYFCKERTGLVVDHDHPPGVRTKQTIYNIRGLLCSTCNSHISYLEQEDFQGYKNFENADSRISDSEFEEYKYQHELRVVALDESELEQKMGRHRYLQRQARWGLIEDWREWRAEQQGHHFKRVKAKRRTRLTS